jgi:glycosyltransferase involved in cell wall biosynthesis
MRNPLSVYLICGANEAEYLSRVLQSFKPIAKEFVVCFAGGNASTAEEEKVALAAGAKVVYYKNQRTDWPHIDDFASARNIALEACSEKWAMWVDADDEMQPGAEAVIDEAITQAEERGAQLIAFRYLVANAGLIPLREMVSLKGKCRWKNRVHEMLVAEDQSKIFGVDKVVRVHNPKGYKKTSADRNFAILKDVLEPTPNGLYYTQQEYFLTQNWAECLKFGKLAIQFPELEDTLRYDVLCNMGRCAPTNEEKLRYLGEAIACQPDRREAHYWIAVEYSAHGRWPKVWGAIRSAMSLPRPAQHYWNLVESIYSWQCLDLYETASVCVNKHDEAEKIRKSRPAPKISIIHATRGRPQLAWQRRQQWLTLAKKPLEVEWIFAVDHDDPQDYTPHQAIRANPGGIINAWNYGAKQAKGDIIVQMSDDWSPPRHWDALISNAIGATSEEKVLAVSDGLRTDKLLCMAILTKKRLEKHGYMFHPDYLESDGIYSDNEFTERAYADGVVIEAKEIKFAHENPLFTNGKPDDLLKNHNKPEFYEKGKAIYEKRKANNWS